MRSGSVSLSANGRAFLFCCLECPCIPKGRAGKGKARPAAWRGRDNRVEGVNLGGNRAPARGRNRNSRPEPTPQAALAGFLGPDRMAGGSTGFGSCQGWGEQASARRSLALSIARSETGASPGSLNFYSCFISWARQLIHQTRCMCTDSPVQNNQNTGFPARSDTHSNTGRNLAAMHRPHHSGELRARGNPWAARLQSKTPT